MMIQLKSMSLNHTVINNATLIKILEHPTKRGRFKIYIQSSELISGEISTEYEYNQDDVDSEFEFLSRMASMDKDILSQIADDNGTMTSVKKRKSQYDNIMYPYT